MVVEKRGGTIVKDIRNRIAGALYGVAIGDALGAPLEFMSKEEISRKHGRVTEMIGGGWLNVVPGEITDDTQMTLAVAEGIIEGPDNPIQAIGKRFIEWARSGPKDIGGTCSMSIRWAAFRAKITSQTRRNGSKQVNIPPKQTEAAVEEMERLCARFTQVFITKNC